LRVVFVLLNRTLLFWWMRDLVPLLLSGLVLLVPLIVVGMLSLSRQSEAECQRKARQSRYPMFRPAAHNILRHYCRCPPTSDYGVS
jgi:fatty acid desaturase